MTTKFINTRDTSKSAPTTTQQWDINYLIVYHYRRRTQTRRQMMMIAPQIGRENSCNPSTITQSLTQTAEAIGRSHNRIKWSRLDTTAILHVPSCRYSLSAYDKTNNQRHPAILVTCWHTRLLWPLIQACNHGFWASKYTGTMSHSVLWMGVLLKLWRRARYCKIRNIFFFRSRTQACISQASGHMNSAHENMITNTELHKKQEIHRTKRMAQK